MELICRLGHFYKDGVEISEEEFDRLSEEIQEHNWRNRDAIREKALKIASERNPGIENSPMFHRWVSDDDDINELGHL